MCLFVYVSLYPFLVVNKYLQLCKLQFVVISAYEKKIKFSIFPCCFFLLKTFSLLVLTNHPEKEGSERSFYF